MNACQVNGNSWPDEGRVGDTTSDARQCLESLGVHSFATGGFAEVLAIREAGVRLPILLFAASVPNELPLLAAVVFVPTVTSFGVRRISPRRVRKTLRSTSRWTPTAVGDEVILIGARAAEYIDLDGCSARRNESPFESLMHLSRGA